MGHPAVSAAPQVMTPLPRALISGPAKTDGEQLH
jgi:hypothetical protein